MSAKVSGDHPATRSCADETTPTNRGRAFGFHRAADTAGAVVGPLVGLALYEAVGQQFRPLLWIAVIPAVISVALVFLIRERPHPGLHVRHPWVVRGLPRRYWRVLTIVGLFSLVNFPDTLLLLRADELGYGFAGVVALYVLYNLTYAGLSYPAGLVSDRLNRRVVYATGLVVFAATYLGFGVAGDASWLWVLFPLYGGYTALTDGVSRAWVADLVPTTNRGTALGIHAAVTGAGLLIAGIWAGLAWHGTGRVPFIASGIAVFGIALVLFLSRALTATQTEEDKVVLH